MKKAGLTLRTSSPSKKGESVYNSSITTQDQAMNFDLGCDHSQVFQKDRLNQKNAWIRTNDTCGGKQVSPVFMNLKSSCGKSFAKQNKMPSSTPLLRLNSVGEVSPYPENLVETPPKNIAKQYPSGKLKLQNCHSSETFSPRSLAKPSLFSMYLSKPCYHSTPKLCKSNSLPEVSSVPYYQYHHSHSCDYFERVPNVAGHSLSSSFDSSAVNLNKESDVGCVTGTVKDQVIPTLIKTLVMGRMVDAMQSTSGFGNALDKEPDKPPGHGEQRIHNNSEESQCQGVRVIGPFVESAAQVCNEKAELSEFCLHCNRRRSNLCTFCRSPTLNKSKGCVETDELCAQDHVDPGVKGVLTEMSLQTPTSIVEKVQVNGYDALKPTQDAKPYCDSFNDTDSINILEPAGNGHNIRKEINKAVGNSVLESSDNTEDTSKENLESGVSVKFNYFPSVLYDRKKCTKKGRPSSKKQKKRLREKSKQTDKKSQIETSANTSTSDLSDPSIVFVTSPCRQNSSGESGSPQGSKCGDTSPAKASSSDSANDCLSSRKCEPQVGGFAARLFLFGSEADSSDCSDSEDANFSDDWSDSDDASDSSLHTNIVIGVAIRSCPVSKQSQSTGKGKNCHLNGINVSNEDSDDESVQFSASPLSNSQAEEWLKTSDLHLYSAAKPDTIASSPTDLDETDSVLAEDDEVDIDAINARWEEHYANRCARRPDNSAVLHPGCCSAIKVRFAADPMLVTVHTVGAEDRRGEWMSYAVDRERFGRFIQQCGDVISPILSQGHRDKMYERNRVLEAAMGKN